MSKVKVGGSTVIETLNICIYKNTFQSILNAKILVQTLHVNNMQFS